MSETITLPTLAGKRVFKLEGLELYPVRDPYGSDVPGLCQTVPYSSVATRDQTIDMPLMAANALIKKESNND